MPRDSPCLLICFRNVINSSLLNRRLILLLIRENLRCLLYRLRHDAVNWNQAIIVRMRCDINIAGVKERQAVVRCTHVLLQSRLLGWEAIAALEGLVELRFALVL
jgi:hypothetical protein